MSDRSEVTKSREPPSTDELLEETEAMLSGPSEQRDRSAESPAQPAEREEDSGSWWRSDDAETEAEPETEADTQSGRLAGLTSGLSTGELFSPKAFLALVLTLGVGLVAADTVIPFGGQTVGMFAAAFAVGLLTAKRRYFEVTAAGLAVGSISALLSNAVLAAVGSGQTIFLLGAALGTIVTVLGYYFGRDLRDGLARDIE